MRRKVVRKIKTNENAELEKATTVIPSKLATLQWKIRCFDCIERFGLFAPYSVKEFYVQLSFDLNCNFGRSDYYFRFQFKDILLNPCF